VRLLLCRPFWIERVRPIGTQSNFGHTLGGRQPGNAYSDILTEAEEAAGTLSLVVNYPGVTLGGPVSVYSDSLVISPFTITLTSDKDTGPEGVITTPETASLGIAAGLDSDPNLPAGSPSDLSDIFAVVDTMGLVYRLDITEADEAVNNGAGFSYIYGPVTIPLGAGEGANGAPSDTLTISPITITAYSDYSPSEGPEIGAESFRWAIGISAVSDVPEPSTWAMMALGFAGLGYLGYRSRKRPAALAA
jgi:hypothetical protein